jgi:hypothetical protein
VLRAVASKTCHDGVIWGDIDLYIARYPLFFLNEKPYKKGNAAHNCQFKKQEEKP